MEITTKQLNQKTTQYRIINNDKSLNYSEWISSMLSSDDTILNFNQCLVNSNFEAFFWEVKPINIESVEQEFEFVLVNSSSLCKISPNNSNFKKYFTKDELVVNFSNLRGDAELIVPTQISSVTKYAHLAQFVRTAEQKQLLKFWKKVVKTYSDKIGDQLKWLSTSGLGVHWLHVRIDSRPKYYQHSEYKV